MADTGPAPRTAERHQALDDLVAQAQALKMGYEQQPPIQLNQRKPRKSKRSRVLEVAEVPIWDYAMRMRIIALSALKTFRESSPSYADAIEPGMAWYRETLRAHWSTPNDVKAQFSSAGILRDGRVVFNIAGNKYRLVVWINYAYRVVYIRFIGTHKQYDEIDAQTI